MRKVKITHGQLVNGQDWGYFHCFLMDGENAIALIELPDGTMDRKSYKAIQFIDSPDGENQ